MRFFSFVEENQDLTVDASLLDLACALTHNPPLTVQYGRHSYINGQSGTLYIRENWRQFPGHLTKLGQKSDVYLQAGGVYWFTVLNCVESVHQTKGPYSHLFQEWFGFAELWRIQTKVLRDRPGTKM